MRALAVTLAMAAVSVTALTAQQPGRGAPPPLKEFAGSDEVQKLIAEVKSTKKADQPLTTRRLLSLAPISANLEYRSASAPSAVHETEAEMFYVIEGSGTLTTGGKLTDEKRTNPENLSGSGIEGGTARQVAKGDFIMVPENTPHQFNKIDGAALVLMSVHIPHGAKK